MSALYDITPFTLLDFPDHPAAIFWFAGCNLRCQYCYNPHIVYGNASIDEEDALNFLKKRKGLLEGVVLSGGEATLYSNLLEFCKKIRLLGFHIKLDTNGMKPDILKSLLDANLLDYVAIDYKATDFKFQTISGHRNYKSFYQSLSLLNNSAVPFEIRTTYNPDLLTIDDIALMKQNLDSLDYKGKYYIQLYKYTSTIGGLSAPIQPFETEKLQQFGILRI